MSHQPAHEALVLMHEYNATGALAGRGARQVYVDTEPRADGHTNAKTFYFRVS